MAAVLVWTELGYAAVREITTAIAWVSPSELVRVELL